MPPSPPPLGHAPVPTPSNLLITCQLRGREGGRAVSPPPPHQRSSRRCPGPYPPPHQRPQPHVRPRRSLTGKKRGSITQFSQKSCVQPWLVAVGGWRRLAVGSWQLAVGGGWRRLVIGGWWRLAVGGSWRLAVDGPLGRSLRAVLNKKKI